MQVGAGADADAKNWQAKSKVRPEEESDSAQRGMVPMGI